MQLKVLMTGDDVGDQMKDRDRSRELCEFFFR